MSKIMVKNISSGMVVITMPDINYRRELAPGREIPVKQSDYENLVFDPGVAALVEGHFIQFTGVNAGEEMSSGSSEVVSADSIAKMLDEQDVTSFAKFIPTATEAEKESVIKYAVEKGITNNAFVSLINKYCGVDVINAINVRHQIEE